MSSQKVIGITCFKGNNKLKFKKFLLSLILTPKLSDDDIDKLNSQVINAIYKKISNKSNFTEEEVKKINDELKKETGLSFTNFISLNGNDIEIINPKFSIEQICKIKIITSEFLKFDKDIKILEMYDYFINHGFKSIEYNEEEFKNLTIEFLQDGLFNSKIINDFKKLWKGKIVINGTKQKTNLMINRNIFLERHKNDYVHFCDDDDISADLKTLNLMFDVVIRRRETILKENENIKQEINNENIKLDSENENIKQEINNENIKPNPQFYGTIFVFPSWTINKINKQPELTFRRGFWGSIICPNTPNNYTKINDTYKEDYYYYMNHKDNIIIFTFPSCIYYYIEASQTNYKIGEHKIQHQFNKNSIFEYSDNLIYKASDWTNLWDDSFEKI